VITMKKRSFLPRFLYRELCANASLHIGPVVSFFIYRLFFSALSYRRMVDVGDEAETNFIELFNICLYGLRNILENSVTTDDLQAENRILDYTNIL
jgi:hypothetical protein